jgi:hypothetical protein
MTVGQLGMKHPSLAGMVEAMKVSISREGMHRRFTGTAVVFMRRCAEFVLKQKASEMVRLQSKILRHVKRILIFDSTRWDISPALRDVLPGYGGGASEANCKVQACYEYMSGELMFFDVMAGTVPDNGYTAHLTSHLQPGDLFLFDLGYFCIKTLLDIDRLGAYFLCRFFIGTAVLDPVTMMSVDLLGTLRKMKGDFHQMKILMGSQKRGLQVACRLVCLRVPQEIANERRRKMKKAMKRKNGRIPSEYHLQMADWTLMVTNTPEEWLSPEMMRPLYSLRWQIELLFKQIKTVLCIHKSKTSKENRLLCEIYGKLIMAVMIHRIHGDINIRLWNTTRRELSMEKLYKRVQERAFIILDLLLVSRQKATAYLQDEIPRLIKNCLKSRQRSRRSTLEIIEFGPLSPEKMAVLYAA